MERDRGIITRYFEYKIKRETYKIEAKDIIYVESNRRKLNLHLTDGRKIEFYGKLNDAYKEQLKGIGFVRIHASYAVNYSHISAIKYAHVVLPCGKTLPISKSWWREVRRKLRQNATFAPSGKAGNVAIFI